MWRLRTVSSTESRLTVTVIGVLFIFRNTERTFLVRSTFTWRLKVKEISLDNSILFWSLSEKIETRKKKKKEKKKERNLAKDLWPADCHDETFSFLVLVSVQQITQIEISAVRIRGYVERITLCFTNTKESADQLISSMEVTVFLPTSNGRVQRKIITIG